MYLQCPYEERVHNPKQRSYVTKSLCYFFFFYSLDNSEWMRNGDFLPSRLIAQSDAAILLSTTKTEQNAESAVSIVSMAGKG